MSRKTKQGYYVRGHFVALGSELDLELKRELKGDQEFSRSDAKKDSDARQRLGEQLHELSAKRRSGLKLPDRLWQAVDEGQKITAHGAKRRQMQFIGKLMRLLDATQIEAIEAQLREQHHGSAQATALLHMAEHWRDRLIQSDEALTEWLTAHPAVDAQSLRGLIRQARKDLATESTDGAPRHTKVYRDLFAQIRATLAAQHPDNPQEI